MVSKLRTFFRTFVKSLTSPEYYADILKAKPSFSWQYFLVLNFLLSLALSLVVMVPVAMFNMRWFADEAARSYPQDLEVSFEDGSLSVNQELPYTVPMPKLQELEESLESELDGEWVPKNVVTFTTDEAFLGVPKFDEYEALAVVTESTAYFLDQEQQGSVRSFAFEELDPEVRFTVNSDLVQQLKTWFLDTKIVRHKLYVPAIGLGALVVAFPLMLAWRLFALLFLTLVLWFFVKVAFKNANLSFGQLYRVGFHSMTALIIVSWVLGMLHIVDLSGWLYLAAYLGWNWFLLRSVVGETQVSAKSARSSSKLAPHSSTRQTKTGSKTSKRKK